MPPKEFENEKDALTYARTLSKNESAVVTVDGKRTFLTNTGLPIEKYFRTKIEDFIHTFCCDLGLPESTDLEGSICFMGANLEQYVIGTLEDQLNIKILSC